MPAGVLPKTSSHSRELMNSGSFPGNEVFWFGQIRPWLFFCLILSVWASLFVSSVEAICKPSLVCRDGRVTPVAWQFGRSGNLAALMDRPKNILRLRYLGHSSFLLSGPQGGRVLMDPYWARVTIPHPDAISVSNFHATHSQTGPYEKRKTEIFYGATPTGKPVAIDKLIKAIRIFSFPQVAGAVASLDVVNTIFVFQAGGLCIAHLGNARFGPSEGQIRVLGKIHVLLLPIDGSLTIPHGAGAKIVKRIGPNIVIPMHYTGPELSTKFAIALKAEGFSRIKYSNSSDLLLSLKKLPPPTLFVVMSPANDAS